VAQVFELAEQVGRRPVGNIRKIQGGYRLRFSRHGEMRTSPEVYGSRAGAERALWKMGHDSERAAMIYQRQARGADKAITNAIDTHVQAEQAKRDDGGDGRADTMAPAG